MNRAGVEQIDTDKPKQQGRGSFGGVARKVLLQTGVRRLGVVGDNECFEG